MTDSSSLLPASALRNLSHKLYEKRKAAALEVEQIIRQLSAAGDNERISAIINALINDFIHSAQSNYRKGGLIGLAAAAVGLASESAQHLEQIVPPVLAALSDQDGRVRYYACEGLYNIAKVARGDLIVYFNQIFDVLGKLSADSHPNVQNAARLLDHLIKDIVTVCDQFSIEEFIPLLRERMNVLNPYVRQFLVGWITVLDSVPDIDMLGFLPDFLDGLFNMLSDCSHEIRQQADSALFEFLQEIKNSPSVDYGRMTEILVRRAGSSDEFTRLTAITWVNEFVKLGGDQLVPYFADILASILPCISDKVKKIRAVSRETNAELRAMKCFHTEGFDIEAVLAVAKRELNNECEATRLEALRWISILLERHRTEVLFHLHDLFLTLLRSLSDSSDEVVLLVLKVLSSISQEPQHFRQLLSFLLSQFKCEQTLLEKRGSLILRQLCVLLNAEKVYREMASILEELADLDFASVMVQALNLILLTASELADVRVHLKQSLITSSAEDLFVTLFSSWCHSPMSTISLCLLSQAYQLASSLIQSLGEEDINITFLVQIDKLVRLLETPIFTYLRLQLLEPGKYPALLKALNGLLMLLPQQSVAFKHLWRRLRTVPAFAFMHVQPTQNSDFLGASAIRRGNIYAQIIPHSQINEDGDRVTEIGNEIGHINFLMMLRQFQQVQKKHHLHQQQNLQLSNQDQGANDMLYTGQIQGRMDDARSPTFVETNARAISKLSLGT